MTRWSRVSKNIDPRVRRNSVRAMVLFERRGAARELMDEILQDSDPEVRQAAELTHNTLRSAKLHELFG